MTDNSGYIKLVVYCAAGYKLNRKQLLDTGWSVALKMRFSTNGDEVEDWN